MARNRILIVAWGAMTLIAAVASAGDVWELETARNNRWPSRATSFDASTTTRSRAVRSGPVLNATRAQPPSVVTVPTAAEEDEEEEEITEAVQEPVVYRDATPLTDEGDWCDQCQNCVCCCQPIWAHRSGVFGEFLYLHPTGVDMAHAFQQNGVGGPGTVPAGRVGVVDPNYTPAFRVGGSVALNDCSSVVTSFTNFYSHATDTIVAPSGVGGNVQSLVLHPNSTNAGSTSLLVDAQYDIDFRTVDVDYHRLFAGGCNHALNYSIGARYGKLTQGFQQIGDFAQPNGTIQTTTNIKFEGGGLRTGFDGLRQVSDTNLSFYCKGFVNVLFGKFQTQYTQLDTTSTIVEASSNWDNDRVMPVLEYEVGLNWTSQKGHWRFSTGYYAAFWFNAITTPQYVQAVQTADFTSLGQTIAFDGLVSRAEFRF